MPYIKQGIRDQLDGAIENLAIAIMQCKNDKDQHIIAEPGIFNYIISTLLHVTHGPISYYNINEVMGILECVKQEYYRRVAVPYEDHKVQENGDVYCSR